MRQGAASALILSMLIVSSNQIVMAFHAPEGAYPECEPLNVSVIQTPHCCLLSGQLVAA